MGAVENKLLREILQEQFIGSGETPRGGVQPCHPGSPLTGRRQAALEAARPERDGVSPARHPHQRTNPVVSDEVPPQLFVDHRGRFAAEDVPVQRDLDVSQEEFTLPALEVKLDKRFPGEALRICERSY